MADLLDAGSPTGTLLWTPLQYACALGEKYAVEDLLRESNNAVHDIGSTKSKYTALHVAVQFDAKEIVAMLLAHGAHVDAVDVHGFTPLHLAAALGLADMVSLLLHANAKQLPSKAGTFAWECAHAAGHAAIVLLLMPSAAAATADASKTSDVAAWLHGIDLGHYADNFAAGGFDDLKFINDHGLTTEDLLAIGVAKRGHQIKLKRLYRIDAFLPRDEDASDDEDGTESADDDDESDEDSS
ncbi:Aste57867_13423 [Aphanomyces stellatus]|uniref:Aste57867_13423 protein n=1 Tax=Aphanomyces stellatus TaxID=120398 RepID=A0A485KY20_9STRA|nr:hypothetical protein As57867_013373 [Aphanomyces stellatus]VFT90262.1 Aste57867_13423 [Aphanomyces stellatus]